MLCNYVHPFLKISLLDFDQIFRNGPNLKHGPKISQNSYHGNEKKPKKKKRKKKGIFARKTIGARDLKLGTNIQLHSGSNMGCVPPGHTSSFLCVRLLMPKMVFQQNHLTNTQLIV